MRPRPWPATPTGRPHRLAGDTDWPATARLHGELARLTTSPVVELNRAVAVGMAEGPAAGLELVERYLSRRLSEVSGSGG